MVGNIYKVKSTGTQYKVIDYTEGSSLVEVEQLNKKEAGRHMIKNINSIQKDLESGKMIQL